MARVTSRLRVDVDEGTAHSSTSPGARPAVAMPTRGLGARSATTTRRTASSRSGYRRTASARSSRRRGRSFSATPRGSTAAASPPNGRGCLATVTYSSPASLASLTERSYVFTGLLDELDAATRFAVTLAEESSLDLLGRPVEQRPDNTLPLAREEALRAYLPRRSPERGRRRLAPVCGRSFGAARDTIPNCTSIRPSLRRLPGIHAVETYSPGGVSPASARLYPWR